MLSPFYSYLTLFIPSSYAIILNYNTHRYIYIYIYTHTHTHTHIYIYIYIYIYIFSYTEGYFNVFTGKACRQLIKQMEI